MARRSLASVAVETSDGLLLAVDPGADSGWAYFLGQDLIACGLGLFPTPPYTPDRIKRVFIECPKLRPRGEKNPNAILLLARRAGEWGGRYHGSKVTYLTPNDWKGSTPDKVSSARTQKKLTAEELKVVAEAFRNGKGRSGMPKSKQHNVFDAIGIGLWAVGR